MAIQIGQKSSPTFHQPLELLSDCHRRVESFLRALVLVADQAQGGALNVQQREALQTALRYFREAAPKHTADEEESLFPRMKAVGGEELTRALTRIEELEADHKVAKEGHDLVEELGQEWLKENALNPEKTERLRAALHELQSIYDRHIAIEDKEVFPIAQKCLSSEKLQEVGKEMASRRGQTMSPLRQSPLTKGLIKS